MKTLMLIQLKVPLVHGSANYVSYNLFASENDEMSGSTSSARDTKSSRFLSVHTPQREVADGKSQTKKRFKQSDRELVKE